MTKSIAEQAGLVTVRRKTGIWQTLKAGIRLKQLWQEFESNSILIEFSPGATLLVHRHKWLEEGMVLTGRLQMVELNLGLFGYHGSSIGSKHYVI